MCICVPAPTEPLRERVNGQEAGDGPQGNGSAQPSYYRPDKLVRVDARAQSLDGFLQPPVGGLQQGAAGGTAKAAALAGALCILLVSDNGIIAASSAGLCSKLWLVRISYFWFCSMFMTCWVLQGLLHPRLAVQQVVAWSNCGEWCLYTV